MKTVVLALQTAEDKSECSSAAYKLFYASAYGSETLRLYKTETELWKKLYKKCHSIVIDMYVATYISLYVKVSSYYLILQES